MILKTLNLALYKNLLTCDFYFIKKNLLKSTFSVFFKANSFTSYNLLNVVDLLKTFKSFVLVAKFMFSLPETKNIAIYVLNSIATDLFEKALSRPWESNYIFVQKALGFKNKNVEVGPTLFCQIGEHSNTIMQKKYDAQLLRDEFFLQCKFQSRQNVSFQGFYQIVADIDSIKKVIFLFLLFKRIKSLYGIKVHRPLRLKAVKKKTAHNIKR